MREAMQVEQTGAAEHLFDLGPPVPLAQHPHELQLPIRARREVGVARLRSAPAATRRPPGAGTPRPARCRRRSPRRCRSRAACRPAASASSSGVSTSIALAIASRSFSRRARRAPNRAPTSSAAMSQADVGQRRAVVDHRTGDAERDRLDGEWAPPRRARTRRGCRRTVQTRRSRNCGRRAERAAVARARTARATFSCRRHHQQAALAISVDYSCGAWPLPVPPPSRVVRCSSAASICETITCATCRSGASSSPAQRGNGEVPTRSPMSR